MGMSDKIEAFILELMKQEEDEWLKLQRNELAQIFGCVPSQINYVIATRFNPDRGYIVRSRRGGGGCVQIRRLEYSAINSGISEKEGNELVSHLYNEGKITSRERGIIKTLISDLSLRASQNTETVRAEGLNNIMKLINREELI